MPTLRSKPTTPTPDQIEANAQSSALEARASLREALETIQRAVANDLRRLDAGKVVEGGFVLMGERAEGRAVALRERLDALTAVEAMRAACEGRAAK